MAADLLAGSAIQSPVVIAIITGIFGVFGGGALAALFRVNVDRHKIVIQAAQGAVIVQSGVIEDLDNELHRVRDELREVRGQAADCQKEVAKLHRENRELRGRIETLEEHDPQSEHIPYPRPAAD